MPNHSLHWTPKRPRMKHSYTIFADYHQFYLWDKKVEPDAPTDYTDEDVQKRIKAAPNVVVIQPERNMDVPVEVEIFESAPPLELAAWDHVAEASLELPSGLLEIHECNSIGTKHISCPCMLWKAD